MDLNILNKKSLEELQKIGKDLGIENEINKKILIKKIKECFKDYEKYKFEVKDRYEKIKQLGNKGKEGITYLVKDKIANKEYAMKTFNKRKSIENIKRESELQKIAGDVGISPKVIYVDLVSNNIVMDKMDEHLFDVMKRQNGDLTEIQQKQILDIFNKLDEINVFHGDSNLLNYMLKNDQIYIIDFGMSKMIDDKLKKKLKENRPNFTLMNLGFILKLKELKCPDSSYKYLIEHVIDENKKKYGL
jgi:tRNA A-37 threonylcarbamoyl transferase component Bud32